MTSALLSPGMSTAAKVTTASVIAVDVAVDYSDNKGLEYIGEGKTPGKAALDAAASLVPGKVARELRLDWKRHSFRFIIKSVGDTF